MKILDKLCKKITKWYVQTGAWVLILFGWHIHHDLIGLLMVLIGLTVSAQGAILMYHHYKTEGWHWADKWTYTKDKFALISFTKLRERLKKK